MAAVVDGRIAPVSATDGDVVAEDSLVALVAPVPARARLPPGRTTDGMAGAGA